MGHSENDPRERGAWAPFVGVALAVLTAGSLVVFSLVAQRTSLDGFSAGGATALSPSQDSPGAITLRGPSTGSTDTLDRGATGTTLLTPTASLSDGPAAGSGLSADAADAPVDVAAPSTGTLTTDDAPIARFDGGGGATEFFRAGSDEVENSSAHGKGDGGKPKSADRGKKPKKADRGQHNKKSAGKKNHGRSAGHKKARGRKGEGHKGLSHNERRDKGHGHQGRGRSHGSSNGPSGSAHPKPSRPAHSSRPSPAPRPQPAAKPKPSKSSAGHSKGKSHSNGRGRGH